MFILQLLLKVLDSQFVLNCKIYMGGNRMPSLQEGGRVRLFVDPSLASDKAKGEGVRQDLEYVKTKRGTELFIHTACVSKW